MCCYAILLAVWRVMSSAVFFKERDGSCLQPDRYIFVALADSGTQSTLATVYLRPSYCSEGLLKVLKTIGAGVLLRDVETFSSGKWNK